MKFSYSSPIDPSRGCLIDYSQVALNCQGTLPGLEGRWHYPAGRYNITVSEGKLFYEEGDARGELLHEDFYIDLYITAPSRG